MFLLKLLCSYFRSGRLNNLISRYVAIDDAMNWLNTLGGGYSALGDYFEYHVCILLSEMSHFL